MSFPPRGLPLSHLRQTSVSGALGTSLAGQSLQARVNEKKIELDNLRQLRDLSAAVASQMEALEQKLSTLSDGTEAIATVVANWHNVLRAINMASAKIPKPKSDEQADVEAAAHNAPGLPQTLVRIPTEFAPALQAQADGVVEESAEEGAGESAEESADRG